MNTLSERLHKAADIIARFDDLEPWLVDIAVRSNDGTVAFTIYEFSPDELPRLIRTLGGGDKDIDGQGHLSVTRTFEDGLVGRVRLLTEVCELVETGEFEEVEVEEVVTPAVTRTVVKTQPKLERRCPDSLLALADQAEPVSA